MSGWRPAPTRVRSSAVSASLLVMPPEPIVSVLPVLLLREKRGGGGVVEESQRGDRAIGVEIWGKTDGAGKGDGVGGVCSRRGAVGVPVVGTGPIVAAAAAAIPDEAGRRRAGGDAGAGRGGGDGGRKPSSTPRRRPCRRLLTSRILTLSPPASRGYVSRRPCGRSEKSPSMRGLREKNLSWHHARCNRNRPRSIRNFSAPAPASRPATPHPRMRRHAIPARHRDRRPARTSASPACSTRWSASGSASSRTCPASPATASPRPFQVDGRYVELVDTGGYGFVDPEQGLTEHIKHQIELAMARADLVLFVVDAAGRADQRRRGDRRRCCAARASRRC